MIFQIYLNAFAKHVEDRINAGYEIWIAVDRAEWHVANNLVVPEGIRWTSLRRSAINRTQL